MSEIDIYDMIALKVRKLEREKKKAKMTEEELRKSLEFVCEERIKLQEQVKELQQIIDKAIEYIEKDYYTIDIGDEVKDDLLNILRGEDNE